MITAAPAQGAVAQLLHQSLPVANKVGTKQTRHGPDLVLDALVAGPPTDLLAELLAELARLNSNGVHCVPCFVFDISSAVAKGGQWQAVEERVLIDWKAQLCRC